MQSAGSLKIAMIGPLPPPVGGVTVLFKQLADDLDKRDDVELSVIDVGTPGRSLLRHACTFLRTILTFILKLFWADVVVVSVRVPYDLVYGLLAMPVLRIRGKKLVVRKFGGNFDTRYEEISGLLRWFYDKFLFNADLYMLETQYLVECFRPKMRQVRWFPNSRHTPPNLDSAGNRGRSCSRFVYLGHVRPSKGIREIIEAAEHFAEGEVSVDVYGPMMDGLSEDDFADRRVVRYCGAVSPDRVIETLGQYDVFLLPSSHTGEGYPGAILEAYQAGLPVICTRWRALPEIVDDTCGILIEPGDVDGLYEAMRTICADKELFDRLRQGVGPQQRKFSADLWTDRFVGYCRELVGRG